jgi:tRNA(fMet)-specific endonuclease VapC
LIFLDTNIISYYLKGNEEITNKLREEIENGKIIAVSIINVYELMQVFAYKGNLRLTKIFYNFLKYVKIVQIDNKAVIEAADVYANLRKNGKSIGDADILIASTVIVNKGTLISNNTKHFKDIPNLKLDNWI